MELRKTPLNATHHSLGGRMVPFAGWEMPVQYSSILAEHQAVREKAGLFDVSHMGEIEVKGEFAEEFLDSVTCNLVCELEDGQIQYNAVLNETGGIVDDITIYRLSKQHFFVVSNASNYEAVTAHFLKYRKPGVEIENISDSIHQIAIQGPLAEEILSKQLNVTLSDIDYFRFKDFKLNGSNMRISRTGYTGEDGFEIYSDVKSGVALWNDLLTSGKERGLIPCGLGARDLLRLEARYALYGHELNENWNPVESGIGWIVKEKQTQFQSYAKTLEQKKNGPPQVIIGFKLNESGVPREGYPVVDANGKELGKVLSGGFSPIVGAGIGTSMLPAGIESFYIQIRDKKIPATGQKKAFVQGTAGKNRQK
ncbi:MAG: glycine cleavage system aminomethyltransferase GcvT [Spirochaetia bacterium]|nr:glycine cleavage system aminomethyltransferase GcvT [Spirochaetia bacterium]